MTRVQNSFPLLLASGIVIPGLLASCVNPELADELPPRQISESPFHYPDELWDQDIHGQTIIKVFVDTVGRVDSAQVEESSGYAAFDSAALNGAPRLRFEPGRRGNEPVSMWVRLPVHFDKSNATAQHQEIP